MLLDSQMPIHKDLLQAYLPYHELANAASVEKESRGQGKISIYGIAEVTIED